MCVITASGNVRATADEIRDSFRGGIAWMFTLITSVIFGIQSPLRSWGVANGRSRHHPVHDRLFGFVGVPAPGGGDEPDQVGDAGLEVVDAGPLVEYVGDGVANLEWRRFGSRDARLHVRGVDDRAPGRHFGFGTRHE